MKYSFIISALIFVCFALFAVPRQLKTQALTTQWNELSATQLSATPISKNLSTKPNARSSSIRSSSVDHDESIHEFTAQVSAFAIQMAADKKSGKVDMDLIQKEFLIILERFNNMSLSDMRIFISSISNDNSIEDEIKGDLIALPIMSIASKDVKAALNLLVEVDGKFGLMKNQGESLLLQYEKNDHEGAVTWLTDNASSFGKSAKEIKRQFLTISAKKDFQTALSLVSTWNLNEGADAYGALAEGVTSDSKDLFTKILQSENITKTQRKFALIRLASSPFFQNNITAASTWLSSDSISAADREGFMKNLNYYAVRDNAAHWLSWMVNQETENSIAQKASQKILSRWTTEDVAAAGEWINAQEDGPQKNISISTYATTLSSQEPAAAADWASSLPEGPERHKLLQEIYTSLNKKDPAAAAALAKDYHLQSE